MTELIVKKPESGDGKLTVEELAPQSDWTPGAELSVVGKSFSRVEGAEKVTGRARYAYDIRLPAQLYAKVLRSPHPHARIRRVDTTKAAALSGVRAVVSIENTPAIPWYEESFVFDRTVRFEGDEVAAVAAETEAIAEDALRLIEVEYEVLPFVIDLDEALRPDAPRLHPNGNLASEPEIYERGDLGAGFAEADVVIEHTYTTHAAIHNSLETHGCVATWEGDHLTLYASTQSVFDVRSQVAEKLKLPEHHVRVIKQHMGGGFGSKQIAWKQDVIAALLSKESGRPVQLMLDREAENLAAGHRNPTKQHVRIGAKRDGTLTAISAEILQSTGAYQTGGEASNTPGTYHTLYNCRNVRTEQRVIYINTGPAVAFRAPGHVEGTFPLESAMDELARTLEIDPIELRRRNYTTWNQEEAKPYTSPVALKLCYEKVEQGFGWKERDRSLTSGTKRRGIGFAAHDWLAGGGHPPAYAWVKFNSDGSAEVVTGTQDIGTGSRTSLIQVAAEELGLPFESVTLQLGDTATGPYAPVSSGSSTQATMGPAIRAAAIDAKRQLFEAASKLLEAPPAMLSIRDGKIHVLDEPPERAVPVAEVTAAIAPHMILGQGARAANREDVSIRTCGAQIVELEVDTETGEVTLLRVVTSHDCGRIINPTLVDSQVIGGVTQGIGFALMEGRLIDQRYGIVLNPNLEGYKVLTVADVPPIQHERLDLPDLDANPTGAKGIGEPPIIPTAPAIANAIFDAVGVRLYHSELTREHLLTALAAQQNGGAA
jgi:xanthine dehydrogenase YagR molybdenum-binding subunit